MRVPFEWLTSIVPVRASAEEVAERLTMIGFEVEGLDPVDDDIVLEVNVTPNRPDCLSVLGIAREVSASYGIPLAIPEHAIAPEISELDFNVDILDPDLCNRYAGRIVKNLKVGPSPEWVRKRIEKCGIRSINNIVDVTNYVLLEFGHPLHAFDLHTLRGHHIQVGTAKSVFGLEGAVLFTTLDGTEREIPKEGLLICDGERTVAVAGIMGGRDTEVTENTVDVFIESAHFDPASIRRTSKALGLRTESSYRFERGTDIRLLKKALDRAALLMQQVGKGSIHGKIDIYPRRFVPVEIEVRYEKVNRILGLELGRREILRCLEGLGLEIEDLGDHCRVRPPAYRRDMKRDADVIEEVARMYGYDRIPAVLPEATLGIEEPDEGKHGREGVKRRIREALLMAGFTEAVNFSFMGAQDLDFLGIEQDDRRRNLIEVRNPLRMEDAYMRTTLVPALLRNLTHNLAHGNRDLKLFEMARVFFRTEENRLPIEKEHLAMLYYREKIRSLYPEQTQDFFILKGVVEAILADLRITGCTFKRSGEPFLHPGQSADILVQGEKAGFLGVLSPELVEKLDIKAQKPALLVLELDVDALVPYAMQVVQYRQIPKYPFVDRDTAIIVDTSLESAAVMQMLAAYPSDLIEDMTLFDVFQGGSIPAGKKSIAFTVRYRSPERTLTDDEVEVLHNSLVTYILEKTQGQLRQ